MFVSADMAEFAYQDSALPIAAEQTISQPYIVACMIDAARVKPDDRVLEIGAGSGYAAAILSRIARRVHAMERHQILAREASERIAELGYDNCSIIAGDGTDGLEEHAPYHAHNRVGAECSHTRCAQASVTCGRGGWSFRSERRTLQQLTAITRTDEDSWESEDITPVRFVPMLKGVVVEETAATGTDAS